MIIYKTQKEIDTIGKGGKILAQILKQVAQTVKPGVGTKELDEMAERLILQSGGQPSFKNYRPSSADRPFPTTLCTSINDEVVHAPAIPNRFLKEGDIIGLDIGMQYKGLYTDMAVTVGVGQISKQAQRLLNVTQEALSLALDQVKEGNYISDISAAIQQYAEKNGFGVVRELVGHGVGKKVHEDPNVPNFVTEESKLIMIKRGMVLALEPMINIGGWQIEVADDDTTFKTADGSLSAQFEHTVAVDHNGETRVLTAFE
ncbi:MAG: type I methionyl aminopeptidase [Candidatus Parcubacteria bacterium]|nr:type I methionyl aminopeptidase [Candidatus Parcubacteria bacterium]